LPNKRHLKLLPSKTKNKLLKIETMLEEEKVSGMQKMLELKMKLPDRKHKEIKREMMN
jgi:hypothetical protein